jgi:CTP:molybdopterin cytidylyltransferase MocA
MTTAGLLLAAGRGSRLGMPKALVVLDGELLVDRAVRMLCAGGCAPVVVVLGAQADVVAQRARLDPAVVVVNEQWTEGMGGSLRCGLAALSDATADRVVVALVDQPQVTADAVRRILGAPVTTPAVAASYGGRRGNPVRLDRSVWADVAAAASGDVGARAWMRRHPSAVTVVACDGLGDDADVDTTEDLSGLLRRVEMERDS